MTQSQRLADVRMEFLFVIQTIKTIFGFFCLETINTAAAGQPWASACKLSVFWEQGTREEACDCRGEFGKVVTLQRVPQCVHVSIRVPAVWPCLGWPLQEAEMAAAGRGAGTY